MYRFVLIFLVLLGLSVQSVAQTTYTLSKLSNTYANLVSPVSINGTSIWSSFQSFSVPIGFTFTFMGNNYTTIFIEGSGFARFDANYEYLANPFTVQMIDRGTSTSASPLSYLLTGTAPNRILKIEWNNCGFPSDANAFANFQLWLYEGTNILESHIGPLNIPNPAAAFNGNANPGPLVAIFDASGTPDRGYAFTGTVPGETGTYYPNVSSIFNHSMSGLPLLNTLYRFSPGSSAVPEADLLDIALFPNPSSGSFSISGLPGEESVVVIYTIMGETAREFAINQIEAELNPGLPAGIYYVQIRCAGKSVVRRLQIVK